MSATGSPAHHLLSSAPAFDGSSFYDPEFTTEISNRMRVPDKISVIADVESSELLSQADQRDRLTVNAKGKGSHDWMRVPERIMVAGNDKHVAGETPLPEAKLESTICGDDRFKESINNTIQMMTPPRTLTMNDHRYPAVDEDDDTIARKHAAAAASASKLNSRPETWNLTMNESPDQSILNTSWNGQEVDVNVVRRQLKLLNRRITHLEQENRMRYQRELIIYSLGVLYFFMKGLSWFNRKAF